VMSIYDRVMTAKGEGHVLPRYATRPTGSKLGGVGIERG